MKKQALALVLVGSLSLGCGARTGLSELLLPNDGSHDSSAGVGGVAGRVAGLGGRGVAGRSAGGAPARNNGGAPPLSGVGGRSPGGSGRANGGHSALGGASGRAGRHSGGRAGVAGATETGVAGAAVKPPVCESPLELDGRVEVTVPGVADAAVSGDFDGDGELDVAVVSGDAASVSVLFGAGDGTLGRRQDYALAAPHSLAAGDVNGDGHPDLLCITGADANRVSVLIDDADGTFARGEDMLVLGHADSLALGDFDADDRLDLALIDASGNQLSVLLGQGDGTFGPPSVYPTPPSPTVLASRDLDGDGAFDLVALTPDSVSVWLSRGDGTLASPSDYPVGGDNRALWVRTFGFRTPSSLVVQTACDNASTNGVYRLRGTGDGTFEPSVLTTPVCFDGQPLPSTGDFNDDDLLDLVDAPGAVLFGGEDVTFEPGSVGVASPDRALASGDFNGDGELDLVVGSEDEIAVELGNGDGTFGPVRAFAAGPNPVRLLLQDVNLDGNLDLALANYEDPSALTLMLGSGQATFGSPIEYPIAAGPTGIAAADLNHDGKPDFVLPASGISGVSVVLSSSPDDYAFAGELAMDDGTNAAVLGDLDGDQRLDLVVTNSRAGTLSVRLGVFGPRSDYDFGQSPGDIVLGDVNDDGILDAVVADAGTRDATALLGNGDGTFASGARFDSGSSEPLVALADFDQDRHLDLVLTTADSVLVLHGNGDGSLASVSNNAVRAQPTGLALGDMNRDGYLDVVLADDGLSVLFGRGDGTFRCVQDFETGNPPTSFALGDLNGDGRLDVAGLHSKSVSVFLNVEP